MTRLTFGRRDVCHTATDKTAHINKLMFMLAERLRNKGFEVELLISNQNGLRPIDATVIEYLVFWHESDPNLIFGVESSDTIDVKEFKSCFIYFWIGSLAECRNVSVAPKNTLHFDHTGILVDDKAPQSVNQPRETRLNIEAFDYEGFAYRVITNVITRDYYKFSHLENAQERYNEFKEQDGLVNVYL